MHLLAAATSNARRSEQFLGPTVRYVGEWHTHPQDYPLPSGLDQTEWSKLSRTRADGRPMLEIIVGRKGLYVQLVPRAGIGLVMTPTE